MPAPGGVLRVRPCGACAAYVDAREGCTHWRPYATRGRTVSPRTASPLDSRGGLARLWASSVPRNVLAAAALMPGGVIPVTGRAQVQAVRRLAARGIVERVPGDGVRIKITALGREVQARLVEMDAERA